MKPIPAIDENGEFVEATLASGATVIVLCFEGEVIRALEPPGYMWQLDPGSFKDWSAVRERVERARKMRGRDDSALYSELRNLIDGGSESMTHGDAMQQVITWMDQAEKFNEHCRRMGVLNELQREGQERGEYDPAASKSHDEAGTIPYIPPNMPIIRQPKRPSFAEALEAQLLKTGNDSTAPDWIRGEALRMADFIRHARAASEE